MDPEAGWTGPSWEGEGSPLQPASTQRANTRILGAWAVPNLSSMLESDPVDYTVRGVACKRRWAIEGYSLTCFTTRFRLSAMRKELAMMVKVGGTPPKVGRVAPSTTCNLGTPCTCP